MLLENILRLANYRYEPSRSGPSDARPRTLFVRGDATERDFVVRPPAVTL